MNGEGWAWPSSRIWGDAIQSPGHKNSDSQNTRMEGTLWDHCHRTPWAEPKLLRPREGKELALCHTMIWWGELGLELGPLPDSLSRDLSISPAIQLCQAQTPGV